MLERAAEAGVGGCLVASADPREHARVIATAETHGLPFALGVHPWWAEIDAGELLAAPHAIGEIGLDRLHRGFETFQVEVLRSWLAVAREHELPVVLHCVRAAPELLGILKRDGLPGRGGMVHGWVHGAPLTEAFLALGLHLSFGPGVLRSRGLHSAAGIPSDRLLLETDCPGGRGAERAEPADLVAVATAIAEARGTEVHTLLSTTGANARRLFR